MKFARSFRFDTNYLLAVLADLIYYGIMLAILYTVIPEFARIIAEASKLVAFMDEVTPEIAGQLASQSGTLKMQLFLTSILAALAFFANYVIFKGMQWCLLLGVSLRKFFSRLHRYALLSFLVLITKLIVYTPLIVLLWLVLGNMTPDAGTVISILLYLLYLPVGFVFMYLTYMLWPIYIKKWKIRESLKADLKEARKVKKWLLAYLLMLGVLLGVLAFMKLFGLAGIFALLSPRAAVLLWLLALVFYSVWTKKLLVTFIYE